MDKHTRNLTVNTSKYSDKRTPIEIITGEAPDISEYKCWPGNSQIRERWSRICYQSPRKRNKWMKGLDCFETALWRTRRIYQRHHSSWKGYTKSFVSRREKINHVLALIWTTTEQSLPRFGKERKPRSVLRYNETEELAWQSKMQMATPNQEWNQSGINKTPNYVHIQLSYYVSFLYWS